MGRMNEDVFVCLDCETTGLDPKVDHIIEVAAIRFSIDKKFEEFESLVNPPGIIPESSILIHHITQEMVAGKPSIAEVLPQLLKVIGDDIIIGHGIGFDIEVVANAAEKAGIPCNIRKNRSLDTLRMARHYGDSPVNSLEQLRRHFNIQAEGAHRAMSDVIVNVELFKRLAKFYKNTDQIFEVLSRPILFKTMPLGRHKGRLLKDLPLQFLKWAIHQEFDQDLLYSVRTELRRRKEGNLFGQAINPFSQL